MYEFVVHRRRHLTAVPRPLPHTTQHNTHTIYPNETLDKIPILFWQNVFE